MKPVRWTDHALKNLVDREIDRTDALLGQPMLLRAVVEETPTELIVVTAYKTSQIGRYLKGLVP